MNYYYLADIDLKENKTEEFHRYWKNTGIVERAPRGAEHVGTWTVVAGMDPVTHIKSLFRITNFKDWVEGELQNYYDQEWYDLVSKIQITMMAPEPYSEMERFLSKGISENGKIEKYYYWADIELKANRQKEYHEHWSKKGIQKHHDDGADHVASFTVISGTESTVHVKRLFQIFDLDMWVKGETHNYHSDYWEYLAYDVKTTLMVPTPYSHFR